MFDGEGAGCGTDARRQCAYATGVLRIARYLFESLWVGTGEATRRARHSLWSDRSPPRSLTVTSPSWLLLCIRLTCSSPHPLCYTMHPTGRSSYPGLRATPSGLQAGGRQEQPLASMQNGSGGIPLQAPGMPAAPLSGAGNDGGVDGSSGGLFYNRTARTLLFNNDASASRVRGGPLWSASPVSQEEEGTDTVLSWPGDPRRRIVATGNVSGQAPLPGGPVPAVFPTGAGVGGLPAAPVPARFVASSPPAALSGSTDPPVTPVPRGRAPRAGMELSFVPLRSTAPSSSTGYDVGPPSAEAVLPRAVTESPLAVSAAVPPTGRRPRAGPRTRSPSPKRRSAVSAREARAAPSPPAPLTLESLAAIMASGLKDVDGKLVKIQKTVDGVSSIVSTHAEKFNSMAVLAESVTTAQGATASAVAEVRAAADKIETAAQGTSTDVSAKGGKLAVEKQRARDRQQANAVKVCMRRETQCVRVRRE